MIVAAEEASVTQDTEHTSTPSEGSDSKQLVLYKSPTPSISYVPVGNLWKQFSLDDNGVVHFAHEYQESPTTGAITLQNSKTFTSTGEDEEEQFDGPRVVEITDEEEKQILELLEQKRLKELEEDLQCMDID